MLRIEMCAVAKMAADATCHALPGGYIELDYCDSVNSAVMKSLRSM